MHSILQRAKSVLSDTFGHRDFRPLQGDAAVALMQRRDVLLVLPTGGGKSIAYQVPAVDAAARGLGPTLVVSPLIALMEDQVGALRARGVSAVALHSGIPWAEQREALRTLSDTALIYCSPERLASSRFRESLRRAGLAYAAVDEAHCISEWGHDFRPEYRKLALLKEELDVPVLAATATATPTVCRDVIASLSLQAPQCVVGDFQRPNLKYAVEPCSGDAARLQRCVERLSEMGFASKTPPGRAIVYVAARKRAQAVCKALKDAKIAAAYYHAGRSDGARTTAQRGFEAGRYRVLVATSAFGMGVDLPDVRAVVHVQAPGTLEAYAQQAGRAGRDGADAECLLLWGASDAVLQRRIRGAHRGALIGWQALERYALARSCRQGEIVRWFTEAGAAPCGRCDACTEPLLVATRAEEFEARGRARSQKRRDKARSDTAVVCDEEQLDVIVSFVDDLAKPVGRKLVAAGLRGSTAKAVKRKRLQHNAQYGALKGVPEVALLDAIDRLLDAGRLVPKGKKYPTLWLPEKRVRPKRAPGSRPKKSPASEAERQLRNLRQRAARRGRMKPYQVFSNKTMKAILSARPTTVRQLEAVWGMGPKRVAKYGEAILEVLRSAHEMAPDSRDRDA